MLNCDADGIPTPRVIWSKGAEEVEDNSRVTIFSNGSLRINQAGKGDTGRYTCTVINDKGVDKYTSEIKILGIY